MDSPDETGALVGDSAPGRLVADELRRIVAAVGEQLAHLLVTFMAIRGAEGHIPPAVRARATVARAFALAAFNVVPIAASAFTGAVLSPAGIRSPVR